MDINITIRTGNCDPKKWFHIEESANSEIEIRIELEKIVSVQSRNKSKAEICALIQGELSKFNWIVSGSVNVEFCWYLHGTERQETDKVGDIDNITKPILDSLTGYNGIIFDDSQIGSLHTFWMSRNESIAYNVLRIFISLNNDTCLSKENLYFIQYAGPMCLAINIDFNDPMSILGALVVVHARKRHRSAASRMKKLGANVDRMLVISEWDIHRTRLAGFQKNQILLDYEFKRKCFAQGFTWRALRKMWKPKKETPSVAKVQRANV